MTYSEIKVFIRLSVPWTLDHNPLWYSDEEQARGTVLSTDVVASYPSPFLSSCHISSHRGRDGPRESTEARAGELHGMCGRARPAVLSIDTQSPLLYFFEMCALQLMFYWAAWGIFCGLKQMTSYLLFLIHIFKLLLEEVKLMWLSLMKKVLLFNENSDYYFNH